MNEVVAIGQVPWSREEMVAKLEEFATLYEHRPIKDNIGGMRSPHMFMVWFALQALSPEVIVESGVWRGQGTWLFERACPRARLYCIDPQPAPIRYRSQRARYLSVDFSYIDWTVLPKSETVLFFDDHQNAYERVKTAHWFGFKHLIFEDNYPAGQGDCYTLKKAFSHAGFKMTFPYRRSLRAALSQRLRTLLATNGQYAPVPPNGTDATYLAEHLDVYYEFPPILKIDRTRWGSRWDDDHYPTPEPLLESAVAPHEQLFLNEADSYTSMCYVRLK